MPIVPYCWHFCFVKQFCCPACAVYAWKYAKPTPGARGDKPSDHTS